MDEKAKGHTQTGAPGHTHSTGVWDLAEHELMMSPLLS